MPLVSRRSTNDNIWKQDEEPTVWIDGQLWSDSNAARVFVNNDGTALEI